MSIFFDKDNKAHWFYGPDEIGYRLTAATLTKSLENEVDFDPRASILVFHNGKEVDRLFLEKMKNEATLQNYSGIWGALRGLLGKKEANVGASLFVLKRGKIYFSNQKIAQLTAKNYLEVNCDCVISAEVVDSEKFVTNALREQNHPELANTGYIQAQKNFDEEAIRSRKTAITQLRNERTELQKQLTWNIFSGEQKALRQRIRDIENEIKLIEKEIIDIRGKAENTYLKEINKKAVEGFDYFIFTSTDLYKSFIENLVSGILQRLAAEYPADELVRMNLCDEVQNIVATNANVIRRLADLGIALTIEDVRFVSADEAEIIEQIRVNAKTSRERKWKLEGRVEDISYNREEQKVVVEEHQIALTAQEENNRFELASEQLDKDNEFARENNEFSNNKRLNPVLEGSARLDADHQVALHSIYAEKVTRNEAISDLLLRTKFKNQKEFEWFKQELGRQGLLKQEEFDKLKNELELSQRDREWNKEDTETQHTWDNEALEKRHESFMKALASALGLEEAQKEKALNDFKRAEAIVNLQHLNDQEKMSADHEFYLKRLEDAYTDSREDVKFARTQRQDDYDREKDALDEAAKLQAEKARQLFDEEVADRAAARKEQSEQNTFNRQEMAKDNDQRRQMEKLKALQTHEIQKGEQDILREKNKELAALEGKRSDNERDVEIAKAQAAADTARAQDENTKERYRAEGEAKGATIALEQIKDFLKEQRQEKAEETDKERAFQLEMARITSKADQEALDRQHKENMAKIQSDAAVATVKGDERAATIAILSNQGKPVNDMVCDKCNKYFPSEYACCPACGARLRKVTL